MITGFEIDGGDSSRAMIENIEKRLKRVFSFSNPNTYINEREGKISFYFSLVPFGLNDDVPNFLFLVSYIFFAFFGWPWLLILSAIFWFIGYTITPSFYIGRMKKSLKKRGYKGDVIVLSKEEIFRRLLDGTSRNIRVPL